MTSSSSKLIKCFNKALDSITYTSGSRALWGGNQLPCPCCRGRFEGHEADRLAILKFASMLEPAYIDVELLAADFFFAGKDRCTLSLCKPQPMSEQVSQPL